MGTLGYDQSEIGQVIEEDILALLDTVGVREADDIEDDKMSFLEAVYAICITPEEPKAPTRSVYEAIFQILDENCSMVLNLASYSLLLELDKRYPRVTVKGASNGSFNGAAKELVLDSKIWSPFSVSSGMEEKSSKNGHSTRSANLGTSEFERFISLMETIATIIGGKPTCKESGDEPLSLANHQTLGLILKFKYFASILEHDFKCRFEVFKGNQNMDVMFSSYLVQIFKGPQKKPLLTNVLYLIAASGVYRKRQTDIGEISEEMKSFKEIKDLNHTSSQAEALELNNFRASALSLLEMIIDFDIENGKKLEASARTSRQDVQRISILDLITDIVGYDKSLLEPLLQAMAESDCKLKIIFNYFIKNAPQPLVKEMREKLDKATVQDLLNCFTDPKDARTIYRSIETDTLQVLLANAFKACLIQQVSSNHQTYSGEVKTRSLGVCRSLRIAFQNLQLISSDFELHSAAKQALIIAETLMALAK